MDNIMETVLDVKALPEFRTDRHDFKKVKIDFTSDLDNLYDD